MNYRIRNAKPNDVKQLLELAKQFTLLNLPAEKKAISNKIEKSEALFRGKLSPYRFGSPVCCGGHGR